MGTTEISKLMDPRTKMRFRVIDDKTGENVLGGDVTEDNAFFVQHFEEIIQYDREVNRDNPRVARLSDLQVGRSINCRFRAIGVTGTYRVFRVI